MRYNCVEKNQRGKKRRMEGEGASRNEEHNEHNEEEKKQRREAEKGREKEMKLWIWGHIGERLNSLSSTASLLLSSLSLSSPSP